MDARLTEEQERIQETAQDFVESNGGTEFARRHIDGERDVVDELWRDLAELDYTAITVPFEHNGFGEGMVYLTALLEALGRYALPGPLPETAAVAVPLIDELGTDTQKEQYLPAIADGERKWSFALHDDRGQNLPRSIQMDAEPVEEGYRLSGTKTLVPYGGQVDRVVLAARTREATGFHGISLFVADPDKAEVTELDSLDGTRPMYTLAFDDVVVDESAALGPRHGAGDALSRAMDRYTVAACAMLVGAADRAVELSSEYGNERTQYGQPIGHFQAVKHRTSDMWVDKEHARSLTYYAASALDDDGADATRAVTMANAYVGDTIHDVFAADIKNHGGQGFTWDHDTHIYLKQAKAWKNFLGTAERNYDRLADIRDYTERTLSDYPDLTTDTFQ
jgi:alkylation response protein AidB-like acyl-CoA dehydrogenase